MDAWSVLHAPAMRSIAIFGVVLMAIFVVWLYSAQSIFAAYFGLWQPASFDEFTQRVLTTDAGWILIVAGNLVGFLFAAFVLAITVVSVPMMLDRNVGPVIAVLTSLKVTIRNPVTVGLWGFIIASALAIGAIPFLLGLAFVMPMLGHASWHLYRKCVER